MRPQEKKKRPAARKPLGCVDGNAGLSAYELERLANIERNQKELEKLGLLDDDVRCGAPKVKRPRGPSSPQRPWP